MNKEHRESFDILAEHYGTLLNTYTRLPGVDTNGKLFTLHDFDHHCINIMKIISDLFLDNGGAYKNINDTELYILNMSVLFHDISMSVKVHWKREIHSLQSAEYIDEEYNNTSSLLHSQEKYIRPNEKDAIKQIVLAHSNIKDGSVKDEENGLNNPLLKDIMPGTTLDIRARLLAGILRLADELDITRNRLGNAEHERQLKIESTDEAESKSCKHWKRLYYFKSTVLSDADTSRIIISIDDDYVLKTDNPEEWSEIIKSIVEKELSLNKDVSMIRDACTHISQFQTFFPISKVQVVSLNKKVSDALTPVRKKQLLAEPREAAYNKVISTYNKVISKRANKPDNNEKNKDDTDERKARKQQIPDTPTDGTDEIKFTYVDLKCRLQAKARIMIVQLSLDKSEIEPDKETQLFKVKLSNATISMVKQVIKIAIEKKAGIVVFPELCIPESYLRHIKSSLYKAENIIVIAGSAYLNRNESFYNVATIFYKKTGNNEPAVYTTEKVKPSPHEVSNINDKGSSPGRTITIFKNTPVGNLGIFFYEDLLQTKISALLKNERLDTVCILSMQSDTLRQHKEIDDLLVKFNNPLYIAYCNSFIEGKSDGKSAFFGNNSPDAKAKNIENGFVSDDSLRTKQFELLSKTAGFLHVECDFPTQRAGNDNRNPNRVRIKHVDEPKVYVNERFIKINIPQTDRKIINTSIFTESESKKHGKQSITSGYTPLCTNLDSLAEKVDKPERKEFFHVLCEKDTPSYETIISDLLTKKNCHINITGDTSTGKSTLISLLYMDMNETFIKNNGVLPVFIGIHEYNEHDNGRTNKAICNDIDKIKREIRNLRYNKICLFIDGVDYRSEAFSKRTNSAFALYTQLKRFEDSTPVSLVYTTISHETLKFLQMPDLEINTRLFKMKLDDKYLDKLINLLIKNYEMRPSEEDIHDYKNSKQEQSEEVFLKNKISGRIKRLAHKTCGAKADFGTVNFILREREKNELLSEDMVSTIFENEYKNQYHESLYEEAEKAFLSVTGDRDMVTGKGKYNLLSKSRAVHNYLVSYYYIWSIVRGDAEKIKKIDDFFPPCHNTFILGIMNRDTDTKLKFIRNAKSAYNKMSKRQQAQVLYLFGRIKDNDAEIIGFLKDEYERSLKQITDLEQKTRNDLYDDIIKYRSIGNSLCIRNYNEHASKFYEKLIYDPHVRFVNRWFYIDYYSRDSYAFGLERREIKEKNITKEEIESFYMHLKSGIEKTKSQHELNLSTITLMDLVIYDHYLFGYGARLYARDDFPVLINSLVEKDRSRLKDVVRTYILNMCERWKKGDGYECIIEPFIAPIIDNNAYCTIFDFIYNLKETDRIGWKNRSTDHFESVADHSWAACTLAMLMLPDDLRYSSFISYEEALRYQAIESKEEPYSKDRILKLLLVHDLAESYTGDIIDDKEKIKNSMDEEIAKKFEIYSAFPAMSSIRDIVELMEEFNMSDKKNASINAKIAYDIDKIEPLLQYYEYIKSNRIPNNNRIINDLTKWENEVIGELKSGDIGIGIYKFLKGMVLHTLNQAHEHNANDIDLTDGQDRGYKNVDRRSSDRRQDKDRRLVSIITFLPDRRFLQERRQQADRRMYA